MREHADRFIDALFGMNRGVWMDSMKQQLYLPPSAVDVQLSDVARW